MTVSAARRSVVRAGFDAEPRACRVVERHDFAAHLASLADLAAWPRHTDDVFGAVGGDDVPLACGAIKSRHLG